MSKMKKVQFKDWEIGKRYFVKCGIWQGDLIYCGLQLKKMQPLFTFGTLETWRESFNISAAKSNIKCYELEVK